MELLVVQVVLLITTAQLIGSEAAVAVKKEPVVEQELAGVLVVAVQTELPLESEERPYSEVVEVVEEKIAVERLAV